jgi:hypothetical protein
VQFLRWQVTQVICVHQSSSLNHTSNSEMNLFAVLRLTKVIFSESVRIALNLYGSADGKWQDKQFFKISPPSLLRLPLPPLFPHPSYEHLCVFKYKQFMHPFSRMPPLPIPLSLLPASDYNLSSLFLISIASLPFIPLSSSLLGPWILHSG